MSCDIIINYANSNVLIDDPNLLYDGKLKIQYERDTNGTAGTLSANLGFTSSTIEASFIFSGITNSLSFSQIVTGTRSDPKMLEVQNDGFKEGVIRQSSFTMHLIG